MGNCHLVVQVFGMTTLMLVEARHACFEKAMDSYFSRGLLQRDKGPHVAVHTCCLHTEVFSFDAPRLLLMDLQNRHVSPLARTV